MNTNSEDLKELEQISALLLALNSEKARVDAEIACSVERMRAVFEHRALRRSFAATSHGRAASRTTFDGATSALGSAEPDTSSRTDGASGPADSGTADGPVVIERRSNLADTTTATEIACLLRISERTAHRLVHHAAVLTNHHPETLRALRSGTISWSHTTALLHEYAGLPHATAMEMERSLLPVAEATTVSRVAYRARRLRTRLHPEHLDDRARAAAQYRRVDFEPADDAMAWLHAYLPAADASAIDAQLTRLARQQQAPQESRTLPHLRADTLTHLLLVTPHHRFATGTCTPGGVRARDGAGTPGPGHSDSPTGTVCGASSELTPSAVLEWDELCDDAVQTQGQTRVRAHINVTVPVLTLLGVDDTPADLEGYGPIPAAVARRLAAHAPSFTRLLTHPESGAVLSVGRSSYAVPADLKRWLRVRDQTCRHPGCTTPASRCELDHTTPWSQTGRTDHTNLAHLCRKHHHLKSEGVWRYTQDEAGRLTAHSPANNTYVDVVDPLLT